MTDDLDRGIDAGALGKGFLTGCGASCLTSVIFFVALLASGVSLARLRPDTMPAWANVAQFIIGLVVSLVIGFATARFARGRRLLHAGLIGVIWLVIGLLSYFATARLARPAPPVNPLAILALVLAVPMSLLGGWLAVSLDAPDDTPPDQG